MYKVKTYNNIAKIGLDQFTDQYEVGPESDNPDAILLRSHKLQIEEINSNVKAIGRAGAGVNNVPVDYCSSNSILPFGEAYFKGIESAMGKQGSLNNIKTWCFPTPDGAL